MGPAVDPGRIKILRLCLLAGRREPVTDEPDGTDWTEAIAHSAAGMAADPAAVLLFCGANAHLIYVAFSSQPESKHLKARNPRTGRFRAASSDC